MESIDSLPAAGVPTPQEMGVEWESSATAGKLKQIAKKLLGGEHLTSREQAYLAESSKSKQSTREWLSSFVWTPADSKVINKINGYRDLILTGKFSKATIVKSLFSILDSKNPRSDQLSAREIGGISQMLIDCYDNSARLNALKRQFEGKTVARETIAIALKSYNKSELPQKDRAGEVVATFRHELDGYGGDREVQIQFGPKGNLVLIDGPAMMMDHTAYQSLRPEQVASLKTLYRGTAQQFHYNNMAILLEFAHACQARAHGESMSDVLEGFHPDLIAMRGKYRSGTCGVLAHDFARRAREELGIEVMTVSHMTENNWTVIPIPGTSQIPVKWNALSQEVRGFDHTDAVVFYKDNKGSERAVKFACSLQAGNPEEVTDYSNLGMYLMMNKGYPEYPLNQGLDDSTIAKSFVKARYKAVMLKEGSTPAENKILGIDFIRGNIYMNKSWSSKLKDVPKDRNGFVSIRLEALARPDERGTYYIAGNEVQMTHREALRIILSNAAGEFVIPPDAEEGLIALAKMAPALSRELFMEPIPFLQENHVALQKIGKMMDGARPSIEEEQNIDKMRVYQKLCEDFSPLCDAIALGEYDNARTLIDKLLKLSEDPSIQELL